MKIPVSAEMGILQRSAALLLISALGIYAQGLYLSCALHPDEHNRQILGRAGDHDKLWTCGIYNHSSQERAVSEADVLMAMQALGVRALGATAVRVAFERERYRGPLYTTARVSEHISQLGVLAQLFGVIDLGPIGVAALGLTEPALSRLPAALRSRAPSGVEFETLAPQGDLGMKPGSAAMIYVWSAPYSGSGIVRGWLAGLVAPIAKIQETKGGDASAVDKWVAGSGNLEPTRSLDGPADLTRRKGCSSSSRTPGSQSGAGPANDGGGGVVGTHSGEGSSFVGREERAPEARWRVVSVTATASWFESGPPPLMLRPCPHVLPSDCAGRYCRGWW